MQSSLRTLSVITVTYISFALCMSLETNSIRYNLKNASFDAENNNNLRTLLLINKNSSVDVLFTSLLDKNSKDFISDVGETRKIKNSSKGITPNMLKSSIKTANKNRTRTKPLKHILSTLRPIVIKLTKPTVATRVKSSTTLKNSQKNNSSTTISPKPIVVNKLKGNNSQNNGADLKQNWYEDGVPYPNPMPEITSSSPPFSITDVGSQIFSSSTTENLLILDSAQINSDSINPEIHSNSPSEPLQGVPPILPLSDDDLESIVINPSDQEISSSSNPISTFNLDMIPSSSQDLTRDPATASNDDGCPTVHISSAVLSPLQRQGCSDLNLVLNTHYHQNNQDNGNPGGISTYQSPGDQPGVAQDPIIDAIGSDPSLGNAAAQAQADPIASIPAGAPGGSGGSGGLGGDGGGNGGFRLPDLKPMFEAMGYLMQGVWWILQKFMNPWLYIIPIIIFFKVGFLGIITLFPWWIPFVFLYFSVRSDEPTPTVSHVKHHHKPVVVKHEGGWFWDHHTNSWKDVTHPYRARRSLIVDGAKNENFYLDDYFQSFGEKFIRRKSKIKER